MKRVWHKNGMTEYLHEFDPPRTPMNGYYLKAAGFAVKGSTYTKGDVTIKYDGVYWTVFYWCAEFRIETVQEFEKLIKI